MAEWEPLGIERNEKPMQIRNIHSARKMRREKRKDWTMEVVGRKPVIAILGKAILDKDLQAGGQTAIDTYI